MTVVAVLLLAALLAGRQLNTWAYAPDESYTMISAGARGFGPRSLAETLQVGIVNELDLAVGWMLGMNLWGSVVGWSTVATRALSWFAGLMTLALVYRVGRSLFAFEAGLFAALLLGVSILFVSYMHVARLYTSVTMFSILVLWSYWRLAIDSRRRSRRHQAALLLGGVALIDTHFLAALMLPAIGLIHLLFLRRDRRWRRVALLLAIVALAVLPELSFLLRDAGNYSSSISGHMTSPAMTIRLLYALSNSLVSLPQLAGLPLLLASAVLLVVLVFRRPGNAQHTGWFLALVALLHCLLILAVNEVIGVLRYPDRIRYFMGSWPVLALLGGHGLHQLWHRRRRLAEWLLVAIVASGVALNLRSGIHLTYATYNLTFIHLADQVLQQHAREGDLLLMDELDLNAFYEKNLHRPREFLDKGSDPDVVARQVAGHERVWLLAGEPDSDYEDALSAQMQRCRRPVNRGSLVLTLYARSEADCA